MGGLMAQRGATREQRIANDLDRAADLLAEFACSLEKDADFTPM